MGTETPLVSGLMRPSRAAYPRVLASASSRRSCGRSVLMTLVVGLEPLGQGLRGREGQQGVSHRRQVCRHGAGHFGRVDHCTVLGEPFNDQHPGALQHGQTQWSGGPLNSHPAWNGSDAWRRVRLIGGALGDLPQPLADFDLTGVGPHRQQPARDQLLDESVAGGARQVCLVGEDPGVQPGPDISSASKRRSTRV